MLGQQASSSKNFPVSCWSEQECHNNLQPTWSSPSISKCHRAPPLHAFCSVHLGCQCPFAPTVAMLCARSWPYVGPQGLGLIAAGCILRTKENLQMSGLREFAASFLFKFPKAVH